MDKSSGSYTAGWYSGYLRKAAGAGLGPKGIDESFDEAEPGYGERRDAAQRQPRPRQPKPRWARRVEPADVELSRRQDYHHVKPASPPPTTPAKPQPLWAVHASGSLQPGPGQLQPQPLQPLQPTTPAEQQPGPGQLQPQPLQPLQPATPAKQELEPDKPPAWPSRFEVPGRGAHAEGSGLRGRRRGQPQDTAKD